MKIKVSEAEAEVLDWMVAKCEGWKYDDRKKVKEFLMCQLSSMKHSYSKVWAKGGPIIEREKIAVLPPVVRRIAAERHAFPVNYWRAMIQRDENEPAIRGYGPTPLIAAMRCYVASRLGEEVEVPEELL